MSHQDFNVRGSGKCLLRIEERGGIQSLAPRLAPRLSHLFDALDEAAVEQNIANRGREGGGEHLASAGGRLTPILQESAEETDNATTELDG
jgi:hypothetical protein